MTSSAALYAAPAPLTPRADPLASSFAASYAGVVAFIAVVTEGSFARAADRLGIGRSAVSRSVQKLEDQLNVRLLLRTTRSTTLTREGDLFYANCHTGVDRIVQAVEEMRDLREGPPRGHLRINSAVGFGRKVVAPLLGEFQAAYPDVSVDLMLDDRPTDFVSDRVDIAFRDGRMEDAQIIAKQIIPMQMLVCASRDYREAHGLPRTVEELADHPCINFRMAIGPDLRVGVQGRRAAAQVPPARQGQLQRPGPGAAGRARGPRHCPDGGLHGLRFDQVRRARFLPVAAFARRPRPLHLLPEPAAHAFAHARLHRLHDDPHPRVGPSVPERFQQSGEPPARSSRTRRLSRIRPRCLHRQDGETHRQRSPAASAAAGTGTDRR